MCTKTAVFALLLLFVLTSPVLAVSYTWTGGTVEGCKLYTCPDPYYNPLDSNYPLLADNHFWTTPNNWQGGKKPRDDDWNGDDVMDRETSVVRNNVSGPNGLMVFDQNVCDFDTNDGDMDIEEFRIYSYGSIDPNCGGGTEPAYFEMRGGILDIDFAWFCAWDGDTNTNIAIKGGLIEVGNALWAARAGDTYWHQTGGTVTTNYFCMPLNDQPGTTHVQLDGGIIFINKSRSTFGIQCADDGRSTIDIADNLPTKIVHGCRASTNPYDYYAVTYLKEKLIDNGYVTCFGGDPRATLHWEPPGGSHPNDYWLYCYRDSPCGSYGRVPENGEAVEFDQKLSWSPGDLAVKHDVYFSTVFVDVNTGTDPNSGAGQGRQTATTFDPGTLSLNTTYYWRIDEVNNNHPDSPWRGDVLNFKVKRYVTVDDFERYDVNAGDPNLAATWNDSRSLGDMWRYLDKSEGYDSTNQCMNLGYRNQWSPWYAETERTFDSNQNWTIQDIKSMSMFIKGEAANFDQPMYIKVTDGDGNTGMVINEDPNITLQTNWTGWLIDLNDPNLSSVNLANVKKFMIGFGDGAPTGMIADWDWAKVDEIRVSPQVYTSADFDGNGRVNFKDYVFLSEGWKKAPVYPATDIAPYFLGDGITDELDLSELCEQWLKEEQ